MVFQRKKQSFRSDLNKIKEHQDHFHKLLKKKKDFFTVNKQVPKEVIDNFIKAYNKGEFTLNSKKVKLFDSTHKRVFFALTKSILGTYRVFTYKRLKEYLLIVNKFYNKVKTHEFNTFEIMSINIIDVRKLNENKYILIEKVHPSLDYSKVGDYKFFKQYSAGKKTPVHVSLNDYERLFKKSGLSEQFFNRKLSNSISEYYGLKSSNVGKLDFSYNNILILDYNKNTGKFLLGPIDFKGSTLVD